MGSTAGIMRGMSNPKVIVLLLAAGLVAGLVWYGYHEVRPVGARGLTVGAFLRDPGAYSGLTMRAGTRCGCSAVRLSHRWADWFPVG